ncbi:MAG: hypothetical protein ACLSVP_00740 [Fusobacterium sp.]
MGRTKSKAKKRAKKIKEKNLLNEQKIKEIGAKKGENKKEKIDPYNFSTIDHNKKRAPRYFMI